MGMCWMVVRLIMELVTTKWGKHQKRSTKITYSCGKWRKKCGLHKFYNIHTFLFRVVSKKNVTSRVNSAKLRNSSHNYLMTDHKKRGCVTLQCAIPDMRLLRCNSICLYVCTCHNYSFFCQTVSFGYLIY